MKNVKRVIVLGLDGLEPSIVEPMLEVGELPHLARLRRQGSYGRVATTCPAQTPVAWSTFATGTNPGGHGIFDFIRRDPQTYLPDLSLNRYERKNPFVPPRAVNLRGGKVVWEQLGEAGVSSTVLRCPCTFPPDSFRGRMLAGMGVPDLRGGLGTSTFFTSQEGVQAGESENVVRVSRNGTATIRTHLPGPRNPRTAADITFDLELAPDATGRVVTILSDGRPGVLEVREGEWSDWLRVRFKAGLLQSVAGMVRFHLVALEPELELYASPVNFDPDAPLFPIGSPPGYARELAAHVGTFYTTGMVEDHAGLNNGRFGEAAFLDQCEGVLRERERMMLFELDRLDEGFLFCLFDTPDRVQHMLWRFREREHPANRANGDMAEEPEMRRAIEEHYRACDAIVGRALERIDDEALFIALSDHGFGSFQRGVNLNTWLRENGFLALREGVRAGAESGDFLRGVDWERTRAYALGLGSVYLNLSGREASGIVERDAAEGVKRAIVERLAGLIDRERGSTAVSSVVTREEVYAGPFAEAAPDLVVNFALGYRASWGTALGEVPADVFEDNVKRWAGDHIVDPRLAPGVLFANRALRAEGARLVDLAPTVLAALGVPKGEAMEGESLLR
jgi:predicted AlkP superfamily phosphohydrolase/phosphomutase